MFASFFFVMTLIFLLLMMYWQLSKFTSQEKTYDNSFIILQKYHLNHHYRLQNYGFGITSPLWDKVFGTVPPPQSKGEAKRR